LLTHRQTSKQTNSGKNITSLAEVTANSTVAFCVNLVKSHYLFRHYIPAVSCLLLLIVKSAAKNSIWL